MNTHYSYVWSLCMSFRYPFQGDGLYVLIAGGVIFTIADYLSAYASILGILIQAGIAGYLTAFAKDMVRTSAMGEDTSPNWVDFSDWISDLLTPVIELLVVLAMSFGPLIFLLFKHPAATATVKTLWLVAGTWGCLTFPILFLAVAMMDSIQAIINPIPLVRAIWLTSPNYFFVSLFCGLMIGLNMGAGLLEGLMSRIPILPHLLNWLVSIYLLMVLMRGIGLLYRYHHERLQWY